MIHSSKFTGIQKVSIKKTMGLMVLLATCVTIPLAMAGHPWLEENNWGWSKDRSKPSLSSGFGSRNAQFSYKDNFLFNEYKHQYSWKDGFNMLDWENEFNWTDWKDKYNITDWDYDFNWTGWEGRCNLTDWKYGFNWGDWKGKYNLTDWDQVFNMSDCDCMHQFNFSDYHSFFDYPGLQADVTELQTQVEQLTEENHNQDLYIDELEARIEELESVLADALERIEALEG
jgi:hypothetical protein